MPPSRSRFASVSSAAGAGLMNESTPPTASEP